MTDARVRWTRTIFLALLAVVVGLPLILPAVDAFRHLPQFGSTAEAYRLLGLVLNTLALIAGTLAVALPLGTILAVALFRTDLPGRQFLASLLFVMIFVPLPVHVSVWQATLGPGSWLPVFFWSLRPSQPWTEGLLPAIWVHAIAAVPWVVLIVGQTLLWAERELEEEAWLSVPAWRVMWHVTLPRCRAALLLAGLWVAVQVAGEIAVTDMFQVRTYAEETYRVFSEGDENALAQAVLLSLPATLLLTLLLAVAIPWLARSAPPVQRLVKPVLRFPLGGWRWPACAGACLVALIFSGIPLITLGWRAGLRGTPLTWSARHLGDGLLRLLRVDGTMCFSSLLVALATALLATLLALIVCWLIREARRDAWLWKTAILVLLAAAWAVSGPVVGLGLKREIQLIVAALPRGCLADVLYFGPSPVPIMWAGLIRVLPFAVAVLWPVFRLLPNDFCDTARLEGAPAVARLTRVLVPLSLFALLGAVLVSLALALAEVGASKLAATPGSDTFTLLIFDRMHYGVPQDVAGLALLMVFWIALAAGEIAIRRRAATRFLP